MAAGATAGQPGAEHLDGAAQEGKAEAARYRWSEAFLPDRRHMLDAKLLEAAGRPETAEHDAQEEQGPIRQARRRRRPIAVAPDGVGTQERDGDRARDCRERRG